MFNDFKKFISRGNVLDLAVAVVIGAAFNKIVNSFVEDILMPPIGLLLGRVDFSSLFISLSSQQFASLAEAEAAGAPTLNYGVFINNIIDFLIVAFAIFILIRQVNRFKEQEDQTKEQTKKECPFCATEIPIAAQRCPNCTSELAAA